MTPEQHRQLQDCGLDNPADRFEMPPEWHVEQCRKAVRNWTLRMMWGEPYTLGEVVEGWKSNEDALAAWGKALEYWEAKAREQA